MTKKIGEEKLNDKTLALLSLLHANYWSNRKKSKEEFIIDYALMDDQTQNELNSQLEKENIFTKIDTTASNSSNSNLPVLQRPLGDIVKSFFVFIKNLIIKIFGD